MTENNTVNEILEELRVNMCSELNAYDLSVGIEPVTQMNTCVVEWLNECESVKVVGWTDEKAVLDVEGHRIKLHINNSGIWDVKEVQ